MSKKAFTLIETVLAVTFVTLVMTAISALVLLTLNVNQRNAHELQALAYAQEGLEVMRYFRDSNWLQNYSWNGGSQLWGGDFDLIPGETSTVTIQEENCPVCWSFGGDGIVTNAKGFEFLREIELSATEEGLIEINSRVTWQDKGIDREVELSTFLSDWK